MTSRRKFAEEEVSQKSTELGNIKENKLGSSEIHAEREKRIQLATHGLIEFLSPIQANVMRIQSVLVWEKPILSLALLAAVLSLIWLTSVLRIYFVIGVAGLLLLILHVWCTLVRPEIREPSDEGKGADQFTSCSPQLLSVPEISRHLAAVWVTLNDVMDMLIKLRKLDHAKFLLLVSTALASIAVIGCLISGTTLCYLTIVFVMLTPPLLAHNVHHAVVHWLKTHLFKLGHRMNIHGWSFSGRRMKRPSREALRITEDYDASDEDIQECLPVSSMSCSYPTQSVNANNDDYTDDIINNSLMQSSADLESSLHEHSDKEGDLTLSECDMPSTDNINSITNIAMSANVFDFSAASCLDETNQSIISSQAREPLQESSDDRMSEGFTASETVREIATQEADEDSRITATESVVTDSNIGNISGLNGSGQVLESVDLPDIVAVPSSALGPEDSDISEVLEEFVFLDKEELDDFDDKLENK